jgi:NAD(P)-dependent dehydrogenase (short-subunit alcohol dehydrogenase family)
MAHRLEGKVILIVGGTSGIGLSAARACIREGASVVATGLDPTKVESARSLLGTTAEVVQGDARSPAAVSEAFEHTISRYGRLDALYHVAGGSGRSAGDGRLHETTDAGWSETLRLNLDSVFYSNREAVRQFLRQGHGGAILDMTSVLGFSPSARHFSTCAYAAAKAAIMGFVTSTAACYASENIRVNAIAPGLVETPMARRAASSAEILAFVRTKQPLSGGRIGTPGDYDGAAVFLLSDESCFMTGQTVVIDGGWTVSDGQVDGTEA